MKVENKYTAQEYYDKLIKAVKKYLKLKKNVNRLVIENYIFT